MNVSDAIAKILADRGIKHVFGIVGAANASIFDAIARLGKTEIVCVHHEQAATMAMQTYYRITGQPTAALVTAGGGSTNAVTGVVSAWMDSMAGIVISGNENSRFTTPNNDLRIWGIQGYDSTEMVAKVTKYAARVTDPAQAVYELEKAFHISTDGRPGPCWIDIPANIQSSPLPEGSARFEPAVPDLSDISDAAQTTLAMLRKAKRPVLWLGNGIRVGGGVPLLKGFVERLGVPVLLSWAGIDMLDSDNPLVYGRAGVYGQRSANFVLQNADLVVALGTRLAMPQIGYVLDEFARAAELVVVDIDEKEVKKLGARVIQPVVADATRYISAMLAELGEQSLAPHEDWVARCDGYRAKYPVVGPEHADKEPFINSYKFMEKLETYFKPDQIVTTDMGTALLSGHQVLKMKAGQRLMTSTGLGEMGFGLPAAIGASFATERGEVMCLNCDGGMMMNLQELQTVVHHQLPIKLFIFCNDGYLMIKHTQNNLFSGRRVASDKKSGVSCPDFSALAKAFDIPSYRINSWDDMEEVVPKVQAAQGPVICEVFMDPQQMFVPKLSLALRADGTIVSPPLEDLSPLVPRAELEEAMVIGVHPKSKEL